MAPAKARTIPAIFKRYGNSLVFRTGIYRERNLRLIIKRYFNTHQSEFMICDKGVFINTAAFQANRFHFNLDGFDQEKPIRVIIHPGFAYNGPDLSCAANRVGVAN